LSRNSATELIKWKISPKDEPEKNNGSISHCCITTTTIIIIIIIIVVVIVFIIIVNITDSSLDLCPCV
jgi:uncharacterized membrane protein